MLLEENPMIESINIENIIDVYVLPWGINIIMALLIFLVGKFVVSIIAKVIGSVMKKARVDNILVEFISSIVKTMLLLFVVVASLNQLGVNTTSLIALIGAAGLAIGLSLQSTLQNLAAGVMLIIFRPFRDGDFIDAGGVLGTVEKIQIFNTVMRTGDNREMIVPNGSIFGGTITNFSAKATRRVDMVFGIGYDDDIRKAKEVIKGILDADERVLKDPEPLIAVAELADSSVNFNVRPWCKSADYWDVYFDTHENIKLEFDKQNISIPYPQMDVHADKPE
jgi:small conductance mechanosensitive channel